MFSLRRSRTLLLIAAVSLLAAACSNDAVSDAVDTDTSEPTGSLPGDTDADDTVPGDDTDPEDMSGEVDSSAADFCALSMQANEAVEGFDLETATPAQMESFFRSQVALAQQGLEIAPAEIRDAMTNQVEVMVRATELLDSVDWDMRAGFDRLGEIFEDPIYADTDLALETFDVEVCGFEEDSGSAGDPEPVLTPALEAYCSFSAEIAERDGLPFDGTPDEVKGYYDQLVVDLAKASTLAPDDLAPDYDFAGEVFGEIYEIMAQAGWVQSVAQPDLDVYTAGAEVADPMEGAIGRIEQFDAEVCGLT